MEDPQKESALRRANRIHGYLLDRADRMEENCQLCEKKKARRLTSYNLQEDAHPNNGGTGL